MKINRGCVAKGEVKYDDGKFYYYRLMPIDNALSGLTFERMKQQGELHGIQWEERNVTYPQDYANDPHIIKPLWECNDRVKLETFLECL